MAERRQREVASCVCRRIVFVLTWRREKTREKRGRLSCKSQPLLHGGALEEAPVWRWSGIGRLTPVVAPQLK